MVDGTEREYLVKANSTRDAIHRPDFVSGFFYPLEQAIEGA